MSLNREENPTISDAIKKYKIIYFSAQKYFNDHIM